MEFNIIKDKIHDILYIIFVEFVDILLFKVC